VRRRNQAQNFWFALAWIARPRMEARLIPSWRVRKCGH
jgi:hypothetical protein